MIAERTKVKLTAMYSLTLMLLIFASGQALAKKSVRLSDAEVKQHIIDESISSYPGNCACPYNSARNGSRCGGRSAWSKQGGYAPVCYAREVSAEKVKAWREGQAEN